MIRTQPNPRAEALWKALKRAKDKGLTAVEARERDLAGEDYARRMLRTWAKAGHLDVEPGQPGVVSHRYRMKEGVPTAPPLVTASGDVIDRTPAMKPSEFAAIRRRLGISAAEMGRRLGWTALPNDLSRNVRRFEKGTKAIDAALAEKVRALS